jgi:hypothetical protein
MTPRLPSPTVTVEPSTHSLLLASYDWYIYTVDGTKGSGGASSIALDSRGNPHIAYHHWQNGSLNYAHWNGTSWHLRVIDWVDNTGKTPSIALDSMHSISGNDFELRHAYFDGSSWNISTVDGDPVHDVGSRPSLALNSSESPSITYSITKRWTANHELRYAYWNGTSWRNETIAIAGNRVSRSSLVMDQNDRPHISHTAWGHLNYTYWDGSAWNTEEVMPRHAGGMGMKLSKTGVPIIAFNHNMEPSNAMILKYAVRSNGTWNITNIDGARGPGVSIVVENLEAPHISYYSTNKSLKHAFWDGQKWLTEVVDNATLVGARSSIAVDMQGHLYISYSDYGNESLRMATTRKLETSEIGIEVNVDPDVLNLKSKGKFITTYIELEGADVRDIDASSILLNGALSPILDENHGFVTSEDSYIVDNDNDGIMERMVKFDRAEVQRLLTPADEVIMTVTGSLYDGTEFEGNDTIRVIDPP